MTSNDIDANLKIHIEEPEAGPAVNVCDFGASADPAVCNLLPFKQALAQCKRTGATQLVIPKGKYYFHTPPEDEGPFLLIQEFHDLTVMGNGAELIFDHPNIFMKIVNSERIKVCDLIMDWNWDVAPLASLGVVINVHGSGAYFDMIFPACENIPEHMDIRIFSPFHPLTYSPGVKSGIEFRPYPRDHGQRQGHEETDKQMEEMTRELSGIIQGMEKIGRRKMRFRSALPHWTADRIEAGQCYNLRHYEYDAVGIFLFDSSDITLEGVTIYSCPGSGIVGNGEIERIRLKKCIITLRPGTDRSISTTADCFHIANSKGQFIIEGCEFGYAGDDCINIHDNTVMGADRVDDYSLFIPRARKEALLFREGDVVELRYPDFAPVNYTSELVSLDDPENATGCFMRFKDRLPETIHPDTILFNRRFSTSRFVIRGNRFAYNRARGVLIHGSDGIVEDNVFHHIQGAAIQIEAGCESRWSEGTGVRNLIIRRNQFRSCDLNAWQMAVLYMGVYLPEGRTPYPIFENITIEENSFVDCPRLAIYLSSCRQVTVKGNVMINTNQIPLERSNYGSSQQERPIYGETYRGVIQAAYASDVEISENKHFNIHGGQEECLAYAEPETTRNIRIAGNINMKGGDY